MSFVSVEFAILFVIVLSLLIGVKSTLGRKIILLFASCAFYAYWDWRFLGLLAFITVSVYYLSHFLYTSKSERARKAHLIIGIVINLGILGFFKYFNFFIDTLNLAFIPLGWNLAGLNIILPIGISFYTFETLSYILDVYRGVITPAKSLLDYAVFITFFPRLISGPIIRAKNFLPQLERGIQITFPNFMQGAQMFLQGMIKKLLVADTLTLMVDKVYTTPDVFSSSTIWLVVLAYSIQVYCDFSGYIDMARGVSKIMGFDLPVNFNLPFTAQYPTEFWRRWNISLSSWFRDYLFIHLELKRRKVKHLRMQTNVMIVFLLTGLWHGASWNFVLWGGLHGLYLIIERWITRGRPLKNTWESPVSWVRAFLIYLLVAVTMVPFRATSLPIMTTVFSKLLFITPGGVNWYYQPAVFLTPLIIIGGWLYRTFEKKISLPAVSYPVQFAIMGLEAIVIFFFAPLNISPFIYFQF